MINSIKEHEYMKALYLKILMYYSIIKYKIRMKFFKPKYEEKSHVFIYEQDE